jgi:four helix bundle protein
MKRLAVSGWSRSDFPDFCTYVDVFGAAKQIQPREDGLGTSPRLDLMNAIGSHKDLIVWRKSISLASKVYAATRLLPSEERFGLNQQLRRAAVSIASNIAEGSARKSRAEFIQFLHVARGSLSEIETQVMIAVDQGFIKESESPLGEIAEVGRLLNGLIRSLAAASKTAHARACAPEPRNTLPD